MPRRWSTGIAKPLAMCLATVFDAANDCVAREHKIAVGRRCQLPYIFLDMRTQPVDAERCETANCETRRRHFAYPSFVARDESSSALVESAVPVRFARCP